MDKAEEPTREMLLEAYLSHLKRRPHSRLHGLSFDQAMQDPFYKIGIRNMAIATQRARAQRSAETVPPLELT
jgi:hypothetical protein